MKLNTPVGPFSHRIVLAPLTRIRGSDTFAPGPTACDYYSQRATKGGLLITEACPVSPETPYEHAPGIYTKQQEEGWTKVVSAVHEKGGKISLQLWHLGRMSHRSWASHPFLIGLGRPLGSVSSSAVPAVGTTRGISGSKESYESSPPRALTREEIYVRLVNDYRMAAESAKRCNFDFVEIHAAHGYLFDQFFCDGVNKRTDEFGTQSFENRTRALSLVLKGVIDVFGSDKVGIRISPTYKDTFSYFNCKDSNPEELYPRIVEWLNQFNLAYLLLTEPRWNGSRGNDNPRTDASYALPLRNTWARDVYKGLLIACGGFTPATAEKGVRDNLFDAVAFGRLFIANPDLVHRVITNARLNVYDTSTFYIRDPVKGYIDYPDLAKSNPIFSSRYEVMSQDEFITEEKEKEKKTINSKL